MGRTISNTTVFNTCKKIAQLQRVISVFRTQQEEKKLQRSFLDKEFDKLFKEVVENYKQIIEGFQNNKCSDVEKLGSDKLNEVQDKIQQIKCNFDKYLEGINSKIEGFSDSLNKMQEDINSIILPAIQQTKPLCGECNKVIDNALNEIKLLCGEKTKIFEQELLSVTSEAERKEQQYITETRNKFEKMREEHNKALEDLHKGNVAIKLSAKDLQKLKKIREKLEDVKKSVSLDLQKVRASTNNKRYLHTLFQSKLDLLSQTTSSKVNTDPKAIELLKDELEKQGNQFKTEIDDINKIKNALISELNCKLEKARSNNAQQLELLKNSYEEKLAIFKSQTSTGSDELKSLREKNKMEIEDLKKKLEEIQKGLVVRDNDLQKELESLKKSNKAEKSKLKKEIDSIKKMNKQEQSDNMQTYTSKENELREELLADETRLNGELKKVFNDLKQKNIENFSEFEKLEAERNHSLTVKKQKLNELSELINEEINRIRSENTSKELILEKELDSAYNSVTDDSVQLEQQYRKEEQDLVIQLKQEYDLTLKNIYDEFSDVDMSEIDKLKVHYDQLQDELNNIAAPSVDINQFDDLNNQIDLLTRQFEQLSQSVSTDKASINKKYDDIVNEENTRHQKVNMSSSGRGRDQFKQSMRNQISDVQREIDELQKKYMVQIENIKVQHNADYNLLLKKKEGELSGQYIDALKNELASYISSGREKVLATTDSAKLAIDTQNKRIEATGTELKSKKQNIIDEKNNFIEESDKEIVSLKEKLSKLIDNNNSIYADLKDNSNIALEKWKEDSLLEKKNKEEQIEKIIAYLAEFYELSQKEYSDLINNHDEMYNKMRNDFENEILRNKDAPDDIKRKLDKYISELTQKLEYYKKVYDERPSRKSDIEDIERLAIVLDVITNQLKILVREYQEMKSLMILKENEYNHRFGNGPKIGVITVKPISRGS